MQRPRSKETRDELTFGENKEKKKNIYIHIPTQFPNSLSKKRSMMRAGIYARFGVVRPSTASDSAYCTNWMRGIISAFASSAEARDLSHLSRLNETFPSTLLHPRKRNKTDTLLIVLPRRGQRRRERAEREGYASRGEGYARTEMREEGEEGGWQTGLLAPPSFRFPASGSLQ